MRVTAVIVLVLASCSGAEEPRCDESPSSEWCSTDKADVLGNRGPGEACSFNWQCSAEDYLSCVGGTCRGKGVHGDPCDDQADCLIGTCSGDVCVLPACDCEINGDCATGYKCSHSQDCVGGGGGTCVLLP